jgi:hypothetical protein
MTVARLAGRWPGVPRAPGFLPWSLGWFGAGQGAWGNEGFPVLLFGRQPRSDEVPERRGGLFYGGDPGPGR